MVGEPLDLRHVVGDVERRQRQAVAQPLEERQDVGLGGVVERRQRLVHQQQPRLRQQRAAERDALALAAGEIARRAVEQRREAAEVDHLVPADRRRRPRAGRRRAEAQIGLDRQMGKEARLLEDVAERAAMGRHEQARAVLPHLAVDAAMAVADASQSGDAAQQRGLAAAGGTIERRHAARRRVEREVERERAEPAGEARLDAAGRAHGRPRAKRFSIAIIARMTTKAKTTMPAASAFAAPHSPVST